jgi:hypothetical protein
MPKIKFIWLFVYVALAAACILLGTGLFVSCENPQKPEPELLPPSNVRAELVGEKFHVAWDEAGSGLCYEILRKDGVGAFSVITGSPVSDPSYTDSGFPTDSTLVYAVRSVSGDRCSQPSTPSNPVSRFILGLKASRLEYTNRVVITWTPYAGASGYVVYRFTPTAPSPTIIGKPAACEWIDNAVDPDSPYFYQVSWMESTTEKGTGGPIVLGIYSHIKDYYEPNNDYKDIDPQTVTSVFDPLQPPLIYSFGDTKGNIYTDTDWYKYVGPALPVTVTVTIPADSQFNDGELLLSFFYNNTLFPSASLHRGSNPKTFDNFGTATGNVSVYLKISPSVPSSRQVMGTYTVSIANGF